VPVCGRYVSVGERGAGQEGCGEVLECRETPCDDEVVEGGGGEEGVGVGRAGWEGGGDGTGE
jgi:hypothetical protein